MNDGVLVPLLFGLFVPVAIGAHLTRAAIGTWVRTARVPLEPTPDRLERHADYRTATLAEGFALRIEQVSPPEDAVRAVRLLRVSIVLACVAVLPTLGGLLADADAGSVGPLSTLGLLFVALGVAQLRARQALVRVRHERAVFVRSVGWISVAYTALVFGVIGLATAGFFHGGWAALGLFEAGTALVPLHAIVTWVGYRTVRAGAALGEASEHRRT